VTQDRLRQQQAQQQAVNLNQQLDQRRDELGEAIEAADRECKALVHRYARPVVDDPDEGAGPTR
jgi:hypothetical protein